MTDIEVTRKETDYVASKMGNPDNYHRLSESEYYKHVNNIIKSPNTLEKWLKTIRNYEAD